MISIDQFVDIQKGSDEPLGTHPLGRTLPWSEEGRERKHMSMDGNIKEKVFDYIATLERTNAELVKTLKICVEALSKFESSAPDPDGFQELMDAFHKTIRVAERTFKEKPFH